MGEVVDLPVITRLNLPPDRVLRGALEAGLTGVVVCGYDAEGNEYFASSYADGGEVLWLLKRCEHQLMRTVDEQSD